MPALLAFGRRWQVASDDFVFPGFVDVLIRVSWLIAGSIVYWKEENKLECPGGHFMKMYLTGNCIILLLIVLADIILVQNSMNGVIMDVQARKYVTPALYFRVLLEVPEIGWNILGTIWVYSQNIVCSEAPETLFLIKSLVILSWVVVFVMMAFIALVFDPMGSKRTFEDMDYDRFQDDVLHGGTKSTRVWEKRCRVLLCSCCGGDEVHRNAFKDVGKIMAFLFDDDVDLVPTDIAAGLILMNLNAQAEAHELRNAVSPSASRTSNPILDESSLYTPNAITSDWNSPATICHFMKYALGSYGWPWFIVANPKSGLFRLWENILCCGCCVSHPCSVEGDNCCYCNTSALKQTTSVEDRDLWYASFHNSVFRSPFFVAIDHQTKSIVIAIRGTMSLRDALTDLTAEAKCIDCPEIPQGCKGHYGMSLAAQNILEKLNSLKVLEKAVAEHPEYTVVVTGHSLGAGAATILSFHLYAKYPNIKCYAFSPPGGLLSYEAAKFSESFVISIVVGDDIVCRLSVPAFEKFKHKLIRSIKECKIPKYRIVVGGCWYLIMGGIPNLDTHQKLATTNGHDDGSSDTVLLQHDQEQPNYHTYVSLAEVSQRLQRESVTRCPMYLPGKIIHVTERPIFHSRPDLMDGSRYEYRWADRSEFSEIRVSDKMLIEHYPDNVYRALVDIASAGLDAPFYSVI